MSDVREEVAKKLGSTDVEVRGVGLLELWNSYGPHLEELFQRKIRTQEDVDDILQTTFERIFRKVRAGPLLPKEGRPDEILGFAWTIARNATNDLWREHYREMRKNDVLAQSQKEQEPTSLDQILESQEQRVLLPALCLHLPDQLDRLAALLRWALDYDPSHIVQLTGWKTKDLNNRLRRIKRALKKMAVDGCDYLNTPSPWEEQLSGNGDRQAFSITHVHVFPQHIAPEDEMDLLKDLGVRNRQQAIKEFACLLRIDNWNNNANSEASRGVLTFTPRAALKPGLFEGAPIDYLDCIPLIRPIKEKGGWTQVMELKNKVQYAAQLENISFESQANGPACMWRFPNIRVRKVLGANMLSHLAPERQTEAVSLYQIFPLNETENDRNT